ncbi:hypothetical protein ACFO5R_01950 [Halosolutus amylolyticus]|uniref:DUF7847 domain-containing protein n=1 Tax=Halosolutus amylolyticus TaxID=2932267 RepID=A0ABD5PJU5_9EURY|nr:hypothetical protein [Halosolutus amylolyticus]
MSGRSNAARHGDPTDERTAAGVPSVRVRQDEDGCGCLACRNVTIEAARRSIVDALAWSGRLFRSRPSIPLLGLALVVANRLLENVVPLYVPLPLVEFLEGVATFVLLVGFRAYVATIVAGEVTGDRVTLRDGLRHSLARTPALLGLGALVVVGLVFLLGPTVMVPIVVVAVPVFVDAVDPASALGTVLLVSAVLAGLLPMLLVLVRFWFAIEACAVGGYGPLESLRVSWTITTTDRARVLVLALAAFASTGVGHAVGSLPWTIEATGPVGPLFDALSASLGELVTVAWFGAYAHLYVQAVVQQ